MAHDNERIAYVNGQMVPESQASISILDLGLRWGDAVYDVERTFGGEIFKLREHMRRLYRSLKYARINSVSITEMERLVREVAEKNRPLLGPHEDYHVWNIVTRGVTRYCMTPPLNPTVIVFCEPIQFSTFARSYSHGVKVVSVSTRRTPPDSVSPKGKLSNKMNHFQARFEAKARDPEALPLMLDSQGNITECEASNFLFVSDGTIRIPNRRNVLAGVTMEATLELAKRLGIPIEEGDYTLWDVYQADEAFLTSSTTCILPVASLNGSEIGESLPGPLTLQLLETWKDYVGFDFVKQAMSFDPA